MVACERMHSVWNNLYRVYIWEDSTGNKHPGLKLLCMLCVCVCVCDVDVVFR